MNVSETISAIKNRGDALEALVKFEKVGMRYGTGPEILSDIDLSLSPGGFYFLTGPSGAGKSTLMRLMYLADRPTRGRASLFARDVSTITRSEKPGLRRRIGVVFQDFRLLNHLSTVDNVALPLRVAGGDDGTVRSYAAELLRWVGLGQYLDVRPSTLSGGQQQRVAIARAVITRPALLLADEPTGNVDDAIAFRLLHLFEELNRLGTTVMIATHNQTLIDQFDYPVLHLEEGRLSQTRHSVDQEPS